MMSNCRQLLLFPDIVNRDNPFTLRRTESYEKYDGMAVWAQESDEDKGMFGLKKKDEEVPRSASAPQAPYDQYAELDAALDAVAKILRQFGAHGFDLDDLSATSLLHECDAWARRITVGEARSDKVNVPGEALRRDWGGLQRFFEQTRRDEQESVYRALGNLRHAMQAFIQCMTTSLLEDKSSDVAMETQLHALSSAFSSGDASAVRAESEKMASIVRHTIDDRRQRIQAQLEQLSSSVQSLQAELRGAKELAAVDSLTQLHSRAAFDTYLEQLSALAYLMTSFPYLLLVRIDPTNTNATCNNDDDNDDPQEQGQWLKAVADALVRHFLRKEDFVARIESTVFAVVIPDSSTDVVAQRAERLCNAVTELDAPAAATPLSVSVGSAQFTERDGTASWTARTQAALEEASAAGGNQVVFAPTPIPKRA